MTNVLTGNDTNIAISFDGGTIWNTLGPVTSRDITNSAAVVDVTTNGSLLGGDYSEFCHTKYAQFSLNLTGLIKQEPGADAATGWSLYTYKQLSSLANGSPLKSRQGLFLLGDEDDLFVGEFLISDFSRTGDQSSVQEFSLSLQSKSTGVDYFDGSYYSFMIFMEKTLPDLWASFL